MWRSRQWKIPIINPKTLWDPQCIVHQWMEQIAADLGGFFCNLPGQEKEASQCHGGNHIKSKWSMTPTQGKLLGLSLPLPHDFRRLYWASNSSQKSGLGSELRAKPKMLARKLTCSLSSFLNLHALPTHECLLGFPGAWPATTGHPRWSWPGRPPNLLVDWLEMMLPCMKNVKPQNHMRHGQNVWFAASLLPFVRLG